MGKMRFFAIFFFCCIATGSCWKGEMFEVNCYIRNTQRNTELMYVTSAYYCHKAALWYYGDTSPGLEAQWKIIKWTDDIGNKFYEFYNPYFHRYLTTFIEAFGEPISLETTPLATSFNGSGFHYNLFKIEGPQGSQTITSKIGGHALTVTADAPHRTYISITKPLHTEGVFGKWQISCV